MAHPEGKDMLVAGNDGDAKAVALATVEAVGFTAQWVGPIRYARNLEAIAELWIHLAVPPAGETKENWGRAFHFQVGDSRVGDSGAKE